MIAHRILPAGDIAPLAAAGVAIDAGLDALVPALDRPPVGARISFPRVGVQARCAHLAMPASLLAGIAQLGGCAHVRAGGHQWMEASGAPA